jgi:hypothetical protein
MDDVIVNQQTPTDESCAAQSRVTSLIHCLGCLGGRRGDVAEKRPARFRLGWRVRVRCVHHWKPLLFIILAIPIAPTVPLLTSYVISMP